MHNRFKIVATMTAAGVIVACATLAADLAPATQAVSASAPATQPAGVIRGRVLVSPTWDVQKPDLSRVVVYLASDPVLDAIAHASDRATVTQKNKSFVPNFTAVPRGITVDFPNDDDYDHNVFSRSKAAPAFDLDRYGRGPGKSRVFDKLGVVQVFCNIHPQMRAVVFVTPNRFFTRADRDGNFEITGVPAGKYDLIAWQERCEEQRLSVEVQSGQANDVSFTLKESRDRILSTEQNRRGSYGGVERGLGVKRERLDLPVVPDK